MRFDDIDIVQVIDRYEDASNGAPLWSLDGRTLMEELAGGLVTDAVVHSGFVKEIHMLRDSGLLTFKVRNGPGDVAPNPDQNAYYYLQQVHSFALTVAGRDRARGRTIVQPIPDSAEDDDRLNIPSRDRGGRGSDRGRVSIRATGCIPPRGRRPDRRSAAAAG